MPNKAGTGQRRKERLARVVACIINNPGIGTDTMLARLGISRSMWKHDSRILTDLNLVRYDSRERGWIPGSKATP